jgi:hypothetical protein
MSSTIRSTAAVMAGRHAPLDAALPPAAAMRPDRRYPGRSARTGHCGRRTRVPCTCAGQHHTSRPCRPGHAQEIRGRSHDDRRIRPHVARASIESAGRRLAMGRKAAYRASIVRRIVDETWGLWSIPSYVCSGDSGGGIFLMGRSSRAAERLVANVSDGGRDCRRQNNNNRLDTRAIQTWIDDSVKANREK